MVQTIGKRKAGGLNNGLLNIEVDMLPLNKEDKVPTNIGIKIEIIKESLFLIFIAIRLFNSYN